MAAAVARAVTFFAIWLALDDNVSEAELLTGVGVAILATLLSAIVLKGRSIRPEVRPAMLRFGYRPLALIPVDSVRVGARVLRALILRRPPTSRFRAVRYRACSQSETDVARRVLTEWATSVAPNRYAVGIDPDARILLIHELAEGTGRIDPLELG